MVACRTLRRSALDQYGRRSRTLLLHPSRYFGLPTTDCVCDYPSGNQYDLRNVIDLARYLLPTPPVPLRFHRLLLALGNGDPIRAICSTLIAQAFQSIAIPSCRSRTRATLIAQIAPAVLRISYVCVTTVCLHRVILMSRRIFRSSNRT